MSQPRPNQMASEYIDLASDAAAIAAGDVVAVQIFDTLDQQVLSSQFSSDSMVRKGVNILGPGLVGAAVFGMTSNAIVEKVAVGHALTTVRRAVDEGMSLVTGNGGSGDSETSGRRAIPSSAQSLQGRYLSEPGRNATAQATGAETASQSTMVQGG